MERYQALECFIKANKLSRIAEIGVDNGTTTFHLLKNCPSIKHYVCVDIKKKVDLKQYPFVVFNECASDVACEGIADKSLDLVFIDADHSKEWVEKDIRNWMPKIRDGGILCGHDYNDSSHLGVMQAVDNILTDVQSISDGAHIWLKNC